MASISRWGEVDPKIVGNIVEQVKSEGLFDEFRRSCLADLESTSVYQNLKKRTENYVKEYLDEKVEWKPSLDKKRLRTELRNNLHEERFLDKSVEELIEQLLSRERIRKEFFPEIERMAFKYMGLDAPDRQKPEEEAKRKSPAEEEEGKPVEEDAPSPVSGTEEAEGPKLEEIDVDEGAELSVQCPESQFSPLIGIGGGEEMMDIDSDEDQQQQTEATEGLEEDSPNPEGEVSDELPTDYHSPSPQLSDHRASPGDLEEKDLEGALQVKIKEEDMELDSDEAAKAEEGAADALVVPKKEEEEEDAFVSKVDPNCTVSVVRLSTDLVEFYRRQAEEAESGEENPEEEEEGCPHTRATRRRTSKLRSKCPCCP